MSENKAVLMSIHSKWIELMDCGKKRLEVRKHAPQMEPPFTVYVYQTLPEYGDRNSRDGKVVAEFTCDRIVTSFYRDQYPYHELMPESCLSQKDLVDYAKYHALYGWHITEWIYYKEPRPLSDFTVCKTGDPPKSPPQSYVYVKEIQNEQAVH